MKKLALFLGILMILMFTGCGGKKEAADTGEKKLKVGMVLSTGGLGDKSFNDSAYAGLVRAKEDYNIEFNYVEPASISEFGQFLDDYAAAGYDLVVAIGFNMESPLKEVAPNYPDTKFAVVDAVVDEPNVTSILFNSKEGSFMVGAVAGMMTKTDTLGYIGGIDMSFLNEFRDGYIAGAEYVNPKVEVRSLYVGGSNPFNDPAKAKELSLALKNNSADIIYGVAGGSGLGLLEAVSENEDLYAIGVDSDQDGAVEGKVLTSMMKRVDNSLYTITGELVEGKLENGIRMFGIKEGGISTSEFKFTRDLIGEEKLAKLKAIEEKIISGEVVVK